MAGRPFSDLVVASRSSVIQGKWCCDKAGGLATQSFETNSYDNSIHPNVKCAASLKKQLKNISLPNSH